MSKWTFCVIAGTCGFIGLWILAAINGDGVKTTSFGVTEALMTDSKTCVVVISPDQSTDDEILDATSWCLSQ